jgi:hypothetical protein
MSPLSVWLLQNTTECELTAWLKEKGPSLDTETELLSAALADPRLSCKVRSDPGAPGIVELKPGWGTPLPLPLQLAIAYVHAAVLDFCITRCCSRSTWCKNSIPPSKRMNTGMTTAASTRTAPRCRLLAIKTLRRILALQVRQCRTADIG